MAKFKSGVHTKANALIERSGGYNKEYHINKLKEISNMSIEHILIVMDFTYDYDEQVQVVKGISEGTIKLETILTSIISKKAKSYRELELLLSTYDKILENSGMRRFYKNMLNQGF